MTENKLDETDKMILELKFKDGKTKKEIADFMNMKAGAVGMRVTRMLKKLNCKSQFQLYDLYMLQKQQQEM